jgi:hypothetical protein
VDRVALKVTSKIKLTFRDKPFRTIFTRFKKRRVDNKIMTCQQWNAQSNKLETCKTNGSQFADEFSVVGKTNSSTDLGCINTEWKNK